MAVNISTWLMVLVPLFRTQELTETAMAKGIGIPGTSFSKYKNGYSCPAERALVIWDYFDKKMRELLGRDEESTELAVVPTTEIVVNIEPIVANMMPSIVRGLLVNLGNVFNLQFNEFAVILLALTQLLKKYNISLENLETVIQQDLAEKVRKPPV